MTLLLFLTPISMALTGGFFIAAFIEFGSQVKPKKLSERSEPIGLGRVVMYMMNHYFEGFTAIATQWNKNPTGRRYTYISLTSGFVTWVIFYIAG